MGSILVDYEDMKTGFQSGKQQRISDYYFRKDNAEFEKVVSVLRAKKWAKANPERYRELQHRYAHKPAVAAAKVIYIRQRRHADCRARVFTCAAPGCVVEWCRVPGGKLRGNKRHRYCSKLCGNRARYRRALAATEAK